MRPLANIAISRQGMRGETPEGISDGLHELHSRDRWVGIRPERGEVVFVFGGVLGGEQNSAAGEAAFDGVGAIGREASGGYGGGFAIVDGVETGAGFHDEGRLALRGNSAAPL